MPKHKRRNAVSQWKAAFKSAHKLVDEIGRADDIEHLSHGDIDIIAWRLMEIERKARTVLVLSHLPTQANAA